MRALASSVEGIYSIWRSEPSDGRNMNSVQTLLDSMINVLNRFSAHFASAIASDRKSRVETVAYVVDSLVNLVANTSEAIARDVDIGLNEEQLRHVMLLASSLAELLTSPVLAESVNGTARIPYINKLVLQFIMSSQDLTSSCQQANQVRAELPSFVLRALAKGLSSMSIKVASREPSGMASQAHRVATTNFLSSLVQQVESLLKGSARVQVGERCRKHLGERPCRTRRPS